MNQKTYPECSVEGCAEEGRFKGMCKKHYDRDYHRKKALQKKASPPVAPLSVTLDFSEYPELYDGLQELARKNFRDVRGEIMYIAAAHVKISRKIADAAE